MKLYLASASPRRQELLRQIGVTFEVVVPAVAEQPGPGESATAYVARLAAAKAEEGATLVRTQGLRPLPVLGADTEVVVDGEILGKPLDRAHGMAMLARLSGRSHEVLTAVCLVHHDAKHEAVSRSRVTFATLSPQAIAAYWDSGEPADKAGGYAIQGLGAAFISRIEGSYSGIVGLPLFEVSELLKRIR